MNIQRFYETLLYCNLTLKFYLPGFPPLKKNKKKHIFFYNFASICTYNYSKFHVESLYYLKNPL